MQCLMDGIKLIREMYRKWIIPIPEVDYSNTGSGLFKYLHCRRIRQYSVEITLLLKSRKKSYIARKKHVYYNLPVQFSIHSDPELLVDECLCFLESKNNIYLAKYLRNHFNVLLYMLVTFCHILSPPPDLFWIRHLLL